MSIKENLQLTGFRKITESKDGAMQDIPATWGGVLAALLRKIVKDRYDGKGKVDCTQFEDEKITFTQMEEIIESTLQKYNNNTLSRNDLNAERSRLLKEFSRDFISVKVLGEFLHILDLEWVDISISMQRKSGTVKSYTYHIGNMGVSDNVVPDLTPEYIKKSGIHDEVHKAPESNLANYHEKRNNSRRPRRRDTEGAEQE